MNTPDCILANPGACLDSDIAEEGSISQEWLRGVGFKYHQLDRQPTKHWLLWLGDAVNEDGGLTSNEDIGLELAPIGPYQPGRWFCWFRSDTSHRYSRFIHVRHIGQRHELIALVEAITGLSWMPANHLYGSVRKPRQAEQMRLEAQRLDRRMLREGHAWREIEKDDDRGGALPEHAEHYIKDHPVK